MRDDGNFVLFGADGTVVWQTFESPTDTLVAGQDLVPAAQLFSGVSDTNKAVGKYQLTNQQQDINLVLYPVGTPNDVASSYWNTGTFDLGFTLILRLDTSGLLYQVNNDGSFTKNLTQPGALKAGEQANYRLTLDPDGVLRLYRHAFVSGGASNTTVAWSALTGRCLVHGVCGYKSYCVLDQDRPSCLCPHGFDFVNASNSALGCTVNSGDCKGGQQQDTVDFSVKFMSNMEWADIPYEVVGKATSAADCMTACMADCLCVAVLQDADKGTCSKQQLPLRYGRRGGRYTLFVKTAGAATNGSKPIGRTTIIMLVCIGILAFVALSAFTASGWLLHVKRRAVLRNVAPANAEAGGGEGLEEEEVAPLRSYSYQEMERATYCFRDPVGRGAFGTVFKGALRNCEKAIAVKRLEKLVEDGEREFQREVRAIRRTSHRNLVRLLGFCHEGAHRLLVYEFMSNGSVADLLFRGASTPSWSDCLGIALDVARGLHYLHDELSSRVTHCDVKPQNILIDAAGTAKIADFRLAKLLQPNQTRTFTGVRGTRGYLAPEWYRGTGPVTAKVDVYS
ncbi:G-type lectin S-receptor-like serine/threonine-protein kinase LECRK4 [Triticum aestivum]|uniref:G-type lectin S-receptor-like serine/threonine-protein kinase LECRK4 n=1 Tax=Triticum aestivum TaxID=4565 RepID=UPI0008451C92|nr:G-type lectin S-receptor-like serine/threonine-protein kinase LECRK4 [Triticum aestivum]